MTCGHFKKTNEWLKDRYGNEAVINWDLDKPKPIAAPQVESPVNVTADQHTRAARVGPTTELVEEKQDASATNSVVADGNDGESVDEDDADAIEALQDMAEAEEADRTEKGDVHKGK